MRPSPSQASEKLSAAEQEQSSGSLWHFLIILSIAGMSLMLLSKDWQGSLNGLPLDPNWNGHPIPLAMRGGDPYIRALMRTISVSESSDPQPYSILYGAIAFKTSAVTPIAAFQLLRVQMWATVRPQQGATNSLQRPG